MSFMRFPKAYNINNFLKSWNNSQRLNLFYFNDLSYLFGRQDLRCSYKCNTAASEGENFGKDFGSLVLKEDVQLLEEMKVESLPPAILQVVKRICRTKKAPLHR